jgi:phospholipase D1/2
MPRLLRAALVVAVVTAMVLIVRHVDFGRYASIEGMRTLVEAWGTLGPVVFMAIFVAGFFIPGPEILFAALGAMLFGRIEGFVYAYAASMIGTTTTFAIVRYTAQDYMQRAIRDRFPRLQALDDRLATHGIRTVVFLRLMLFLAPPLNWTLGASRVTLRDYVVGTALGILPGLTLVAWLADAIARAGTFADLLTVEFVGVAIVLTALLGAGVVAGWRLLGRTTTTD